MRLQVCTFCDNNVGDINVVIIREWDRYLHELQKYFKTENVYIDEVISIVFSLFVDIFVKYRIIPELKQTK